MLFQSCSFVGWFVLAFVLMVLVGTWEEEDGMKATISSIFSVFYARFQSVFPKIGAKIPRTYKHTL